MPLQPKGITGFVTCRAYHAFYAGRQRLFPPKELTRWVAFVTGAISSVILEAPEHSIPKSHHFVRFMSGKAEALNHLQIF